MLPYRLRTPVFGNFSENRQRKLDGTQKQVTQFGGPVQRSISQDLEAFRQTVVHQITLPGNNTAASNWKRGGDAFQFFKQQFGSAKIALLHLLVPHPRCDREAYAQIIYAACFELFRNSMKADNLLDACIAIMILYTLYETNPLLRTETMTPSDYLPNGWKDSRTYRRAFRQPIRIDQEHFLWIMRLQTQCGAHVDRCREEDTFTPLTGIAKDTRIILDRLFQHWDFCDYTGPVGLEALAGHADYPYRDNSPKVRKSKAAKSKSPSQSMPVEARQVPTIPAPNVHGAETDDLSLVASIEEYQKAIQSIHLGTRKTPLTTQLRKTLGPILPHKGKKSWFDLIQTGDSSDTGMTSSLARHRLEDEPFFGTTESDNDDDQGLKPNTSLQEIKNDNHTLSYKLQLSEEVPTELHSYLQATFQQVIQRGEIDFMVQPRAGHDKSGLESDVSTLGDGGISLATGQGRTALQNLLTSAKPPALRVPARVSTTPLIAAPPQEQNLKARFLQSDRDLQSSDDDDASSVVSNLSIDSDLEEDKDEESVATSAMGRRALNHLLRKVSNEAKGSKAKRSRSTPHKPPVDPHSEQSTTSSIGAGRMALDSLLQRASAQQKRKMPDSTIGHSTESPTTAPASRKRPRMPSEQTTMPPPKSRIPRLTTKQKSGVHESADSSNDDVTIGAQSIASSVGPGEVALLAILKEATAAKKKNGPNDAISKPETASRKHTRATGQTKMPPPKAWASKSATRTKRVTHDIADSQSTHDDLTVGDQSMASSIGPGKKALQAILEHASTKGERKSSNDTSLKPESRQRNVTSRQAKLPLTKARVHRSTATSKLVPFESANSEGDDLTLGDESMASSVGPGGLALRAMLAQSTGKK